MFADILEALSSRKGLPTNRKIKSLNPFVKHETGLRVGGRLVNAKSPYNARHLVILLSHNTVKAYVRYIH